MSWRVFWIGKLPLTARITSDPGDSCRSGDQGEPTATLREEYFPGDSFRHGTTPEYRRSLQTWRRKRRIRGKSTCQADAHCVNRISGPNVDTV